MNELIFSILAIAFVVNVLYYPVVSLLEHMWAFVSRTKVKGWAKAWQDFKWDWWESADDTVEQVMRYFITDVFCALVAVLFAATLGMLGILSWFIGIPLVTLGAMYGVRWFMDSQA